MKNHYHLVGGNCYLAASFNTCVFLTTILGIGSLTYLALK